MILHLDDVVKRYGKSTAVAGVSFEVGRGETVALLGPNGAGKTTTLDIALGLRRADSGRATLFGGDPRDIDVRRRIGATPQQSGMPAALRVREIAHFVARHFPRPAEVDATLSAFGLFDLAHRQTGGLSGGELRRLGLALAFIGNPEFVVLDEPTTGLDLESRHRTWAYVRAYVAGGGTVLFTTHHMEEAEALASRVLVIAEGRVTFDAAPAEIRGRYGVRRLHYVGDPFDPRAYGIECTVEDLDGRVRVTAADTDALVRSMVSLGIPFKNLQIENASLEEALDSAIGEVR